MKWLHGVFFADEDIPWQSKYLHEWWNYKAFELKCWNILKTKNRLKKPKSTKIHDLFLQKVANSWMEKFPHRKIRHKVRAWANCRVHLNAHGEWYFINLFDLFLWIKKSTHKKQFKKFLQTD
jgi:hypothetical protein